MVPYVLSAGPVQGQGSPDEALFSTVAASQGGRAIEPPAFQRSSYEWSQERQPPDGSEAPVSYRFEPFWTHLGLI